MTAPDERPAPLEGVVVDLNAEHSDAWNSRIAKFVLEGTPVYHVKEVIEQLSGRVEINHLSENTLGSLNPNDLYLKAKGGFDFLVAAVLLIVTLPLFLLMAILIRLDSSGPALFRQQRTGFRAQPFTIYKFRTMRIAPAGNDKEEERRLAAMTADDDVRITRLGAFLRKTRIDELPQLINILKGEMSLIGPRPEVVALTRWYEREIAFYHYRHIIKPGITGWAQINLGHVAEVDDVRRKLDFDFYYVKNFSVWLDLLIVLRTIRTIITGSGAK
jgi:exopolysaccharide biosynthesis polyprenyl glycosylphosphotransferase